MRGPILAAVDLTDQDAARAVVREAVFEADARDTALEAMAVVPEAFAGLDWRYAIRGTDRSPPAGARRELVRQTLDRLNEIVADETVSDTEVATHAVFGVPYQGILAKAHEIRPSLIVIASGQSSWRVEEIGPNAARVARHAPCAVLLVRCADP